MQNRQDAQIRDLYRGHEIRVWAGRNASGAWRHDVQVVVGDARGELRVPAADGPDWMTESEALRAGVERGRHLVDKHVDDD
ncbi:DUF6566 family protein [Burkholderia metallica]|uniref:DUF6566 family protein n=1 Tax=Burkholderia metallica TaxID=488729 RepID=UPI0008418637|nr:DUF6566 family protein [Burkholderia metallica]AOJ33505.1 citramalate synthase [Burkholderia metallica]